MDIWVKRDEVNYLKLVSAFNKFGLSVFDMSQINFLSHETWDVFSFGTPPVCIDILVKVKGLDFDECFKSSQIFEDDGLKVRTINYNYLIVAKKSANRPKDIDDINNLTK